MLVPAAEAGRGAAAQRAQPGPRGRHAAGSTTTGSASTTGCRDVPAAIGIAQVERLDEMLAGAGRRRRRLRERPRRPAPRPRRGRARRAGAAAARPRRRRGAAGSSTWSALADGADRDAVDRRARRSAASSPRPTCPASTCARTYRERFGFRGGEFPVAEAVRRARWRCRSSRRWARARSSGSARPLRRRARRERLAPRTRAPGCRRLRRCPLPRSSPIRSSGGSTARSSSTGGWRPYDVEQSRAHARALSRLGVLDDDELRAARGPRRGRGRARADGASTSRRPTKTSTWRSSGG